MLIVDKFYWREDYDEEKQIGYKVFNTKDSKFQYSVYFKDGQITKIKPMYKDEETYPLTEEIEQTIHKAIDDQRNGICPNCGRPNNINRKVEGSCDICALEELIEANKALGWTPKTSATLRKQIKQLEETKKIIEKKIPVTIK